ncbi:MAG: cytochrome P450 [Deltaproteobacteria bacterium]|jgi:cholest-4-en-3-one 26-monooxygenase|nr:cytochrome P450 [Deltaproteobacteria bacterium]MBW2497369.1 cytochrome P450 [Deltaproteobacteria bacterium]
MSVASTAPLAGPELIDPDLYAANGYPFETWDRLRREAPVLHYEGPDYPFWVLTRHQDIVEASRQPELFSNLPRFQIMVGADYGSDDEREPETMIHMDPPRHRQFRELLARRFTPREMRKIEAQMTELAREIVDELAADRSEGECDFVEKIAAPLPLAAIAWLLDLPRTDWMDLYHWANAVVGATDPEYQRPGEDAHETRMRANTEIYDYFYALTEERKQGDADDLVSVLTRAEVDGAPLTPHQLVSYCHFLVAGGTETTRNALSGGIQGFFEHPDEWRKLADDPSKVQRATEEILRWSTPVVQMARTPVRDVEIRGQQIRAGETVAMFYGSGNRDEEVFDDPYRFDIERHPNPHLSLGVGEHYCMGANLARLELRVMLRQLVTRFEALEPAGPIERLRSSSTGGVKALPVHYRIGS